MIYARSVLLALEAFSARARLGSKIDFVIFARARLENFFARLARARKIYARTQQYLRPCDFYETV